MQQQNHQQLMIFLLLHHLLSNVKIDNLVRIQINGRKRGLVNAKLDLLEEDLMKLVNDDKNINKYLIDKEIKKKIYIKNKLMNIII